MRGTAALLCSLLALAAATAVGRDDLGAARDRARAIGERHGLRIVFAETGTRHETALASADPERVAEALDELEHAIARYPQRFLQAAGLHEIRLAAALYVDGIGIGGHAAPCAGRLTLDARWGIDRGFDHELFHLFDCAFFHRVMRPKDRVSGQRVIQTCRDDFEWRSLNPAGFDYTPSVRDCHMIASDAIEHPLPGTAPPRISPRSSSRRRPASRSCTSRTRGFRSR